MYISHPPGSRQGRIHALHLLQLGLDRVTDSLNEDSALNPHCGSVALPAPKSPIWLKSKQPFNPPAAARGQCLRPESPIWLRKIQLLQSTLRQHVGQCLRPQSHRFGCIADTATPIPTSPAHGQCLRPRVTRRCHEDTASPFHTAAALAVPAPQGHRFGFGCIERSFEIPTQAAHLPTW